LQITQGNQQFCHFGKTRGVVLNCTGNFFIPSPTANLVGIEEGQTEIIFHKKKDVLLFSFASFFVFSGATTKCLLKGKVPSSACLAELFIWQLTNNTKTNLKDLLKCRSLHEVRAKRHAYFVRVSAFN
jgi:hypothetical protein